jgi:hypothetical protein
MKMVELAARAIETRGGKNRFGSFLHELAYYIRFAVRG